MTELLSRIRKKDKEAVTILYNNYGRKLYAFAINRWNLNEDEAWDLIYKTLYKILDVIDRYKFECDTKFAGFIFQSYVNNLRNHYQANKNKPALVLDDEGLSEYSREFQEDNFSEESQQMKIMKEALTEFEDWERVLLLMRAQEYSYEQISTFVNKPASQLKVYYLRLKQRLTNKVNDRLNNNS